MKNNLKKIGIVTLAMIASMGMGAVGEGVSVKAATVGKQLSKPENGWTRYNDSDSNIKYEGKWAHDLNRAALFPGVYQDDLHGNYGKVGCKIKFGFYGSKLRIISGAGHCYSGANVKIDDVDCGNYSAYYTPNYLGALLFFEKLGLSEGYHKVELTSIDRSIIAPRSSNSYFALDAIDVDSSGKLDSYKNIVVVSSIALNKNADTLEVGDVDQLTATINPSNATNKNITWTSSNPAVATVDNTGKVEAVAEGDAVITVQAQDSNVKASCNVKVNKKNLVKDNNLKILINQTLGRDENLPLGKEDLEKVTALLGENKNIVSLEGLQYCTNLEWMYIPNNPISDLTPLKDLKKLNTLYVYGSEISDLSPLENLTQLEELSVAYSNVSNISSLKDLTNLKKLYLNNNKITDISELKNINSLKYLAVSNNNISDISVVQNFVNLIELGANDNNISDISAVGGLTKLNYLSLSTNKIKDVTPIANLNDLKSLYLFGNEISDFSPIEDIIGNIHTVIINRQRV